MRNQLVASLVLAACGGALAQGGPEALHVRSVAASCAQCHGTDGRAAAGSALPALAGMQRDYLLAQLQAFKAGTRPSTIMGQLAKGYSDAQLAQLATFFAGQR